MVTTRQIKQPALCLDGSQADLVRRSWVFRSLRLLVWRRPTAIWVAEKKPDKKLGMPSRLLAFNSSKKTEEGRVPAFGSQESAGRQKAAGLEFIDENGGGAGVRLRKRGQRVTPK